jgi:hypothetical protein
MSELRVVELEFEHFEEVQQLLKRHGLSNVGYADWSRRWTENPAWNAESALPLGWVIERKKKICGVLHCIPTSYVMEGQSLLAAAGHAMAVDSEARSSSLQMISQLMRQPHADMVINTTVNAAAERVFRAFGAKEIPNSHCGQVLAWPVSYSELVGAALRRKQLQYLRPLQPLAGAILRLFDLIRRRNLPISCRDAVDQSDHFDERFDDFWRRLQQTRSRLMAVRDRATLQWHFGPSLAASRSLLLTYQPDGQLEAYMVLTRMDNDSIGLRRFRITDLQTVTDSEEAVLALLGKAVCLAREHGAQVLDAIGFEAFKRGLMSMSRPYERALPSCSYLYKCLNPTIEAKLRDPAMWDPSPYDGDASL